MNILTSEENRIILFYVVYLGQQTLAVDCKVSSLYFKTVFVISQGKASCSEANMFCEFNIYSISGI